MLPDAAPADGDIVIDCNARSVSGFLVSTMPGPPQMVFASYERALREARRFAMRTGVDVWFAEDGRGVALVARNRREVRGR
jgi:hypothetical protein